MNIPSMFACVDSIICYYTSQHLAPNTKTPGIYKIATCRTEVNTFLFIVLNSELYEIGSLDEMGGMKNEEMTGLPNGY